MLTPNMIDRFKRDCEERAKEPLTIEAIGGALYAFGSELACLRLYHAHRGASHARVGYSENLGTWYFSLELKA